MHQRLPGSRVVIASLGVAVVLLVPAPANAQVTRLEVTSRSPVAGGPFGAAGEYENVRGRVYGEIDPADRRNRIIQDLDLAPRNDRRRIEYVATFSLTKPVDAAKASGVLMYSVVNRGDGNASAGPAGHISLVSGWQGDVPPTANNQTIRVPIARNADGSPVTGPVLARFSDLPAGTTTAALRLGSLGTASYPAATLDTSRASLTFHASETRRRPDHRERSRGEPRMGVCRLPDRSVSWHARSDAPLSEKRIRSGVAV